jgi:antitoxin HigA-1
MAKLSPVTPGELLREEFLVPLGLTQYRLAREIGVPAQRIGAIVAGKRSITADTDLRLCRFFGYPTAIGCGRRPPMTRKSHKGCWPEALKKIRPWAGSAA